MILLVRSTMRTPPPASEEDGWRGPIETGRAFADAPEQGRLRRAGLLPDHGLDAAAGSGSVCRRGNVCLSTRRSCERDWRTGPLRGSTGLGSRIGFSRTTGQKPKVGPIVTGHLGIIFRRFNHIARSGTFPAPFQHLFRRTPLESRVGALPGSLARSAEKNETRRVRPGRYDIGKSVTIQIANRNAVGPAPRVAE